MEQFLEGVIEKQYDGYSIQEYNGTRYISLKTDEILTHEGVDEIIQNPEFNGDYVLDVSGIRFNGHFTKRLSVLTAIIAEQLAKEQSRSIKFRLNKSQRDKIEMIVSSDIVESFLYETIDDYLVAEGTQIDSSKETTTLTYKT